MTDAHLSGASTPQAASIMSAPPPADPTRLWGATAVIAFACLVEAAVVLWQGDVLHGLSTRLDDHTLTLSWLDDKQTLLHRLDFVLLGVIVVKALFLGLWSLYCRKHVESLGVIGFRRSRGWAFGGWICPVVNFWFPYQTVSDNAAVRRSAWPKQVSARDTETPMLVKIWWTAWVLTLVLDRWVDSQIGSASTPADIHNDLDLVYVAFAATILVGVLTVGVVGWLSRLIKTADANVTR